MDNLISLAVGNKGVAVFSLTTAGFSIFNFLKHYSINFKATKTEFYLEIKRRKT